MYRLKVLTNEGNDGALDGGCMCHHCTWAGMHSPRSARSCSSCCGKLKSVPDAVQFSANKLSGSSCTGHIDIVSGQHEAWYVLLESVCVHEDCEYKDMRMMETQPDGDVVM